MKSESIGKIALALSKAQSKIHGAIKDSNNPFFKSSYADLASVMDAVRSPFADNELSYVQPVTTVDGQLYVQTILMHSSGEYIESLYPVVAKEMNDAQKVGGAVTYARRYSLASMCGVSQVDDDGNTAANIEAPKQAPKPLVNHAPIGVNHITADRENGMKFGKSTKTVSEAQLKRLDAIAYKAGWAFGDIITECKARFNCDTGSLNMNQYDELCTYIQSNKPKEESMPF
jgi:hypothetical protein